jgi:iron-sulfur cluster assembly protein
MSEKPLPDGQRLFIFSRYLESFLAVSLLCQRRPMHAAGPSSSPHLSHLLVMITVSDKAKEKVEHLMRDAELDATYRLRASVAGGGCSGLSYKLDFDNETRPMDQEFEDKGVRVVVDMKSFLYLAGTELDFSDGLNGKGFQFHNPNASRSCGCGESFSV